MLNTGAPSPEDLVRQHNLPHQKVLFDIDLQNPTKNTIGGDPRDLTETEMSAIKSFGTRTAVVTIYSHVGAEDDVSEFLARRPDMTGVIASYAEDYMAKGETDFAMRQHTDEEVGNMLHNELVRQMRLGDSRN